MSGLIIYNLFMLYVSCIACDFSQVFFHCWYLKCKSMCREEASQPFSVLIGGTQGHVSVKVI